LVREWHQQPLSAIKYEINKQKSLLALSESHFCKAALQQSQTGDKRQAKSSPFRHRNRKALWQKMRTRAHHSSLPAQRGDWCKSAPTRIMGLTPSYTSSGFCPQYLSGRSALPETSRAHRFRTPARCDVPQTWLN